MNHHERMEQPEVLGPTEARQASPQRMNLRVLIGSLLLATVVGGALLAAFWYATPPAMDASSGGTPSVAPATPEGTAAGRTPEGTAAGPGPTATQPPPASSATPTPPTTETAPGSAETPSKPNAVTAPPAPPGNNPGAGTATP